VGAGAAGRLSAFSKGHVPGEPGIWILLFGDLGVFSVLFATYLHDRGQHLQLFAHSQGALNRNLGATNTLVLLASSLLVVLSTHALQRDTMRSYAPGLVLGAIGLGLCFIMIKAFEYHEKVSAGITPSTNGYYTWYFVLTGLHLLHVIIGLGVLTALWKLARKPVSTPTHVAYFEGGACFWHLVDLLWILIFPLIFLVR
jgi:nitric oxide reductase NorE protein